LTQNADKEYVTSKEGNMIDFRTDQYQEGKILKYFCLSIKDGIKSETIERTGIFDNEIHQLECLNEFNKQAQYRETVFWHYWR
jgi:hypothetical protein